ncbi:MAG: cytochrome-c peroxidase [Limisphaerales bacterium]
MTDKPDFSSRPGDNPGSPIVAWLLVAAVVVLAFAVVPGDLPVSQINPRAAVDSGQYETEFVTPLRRPVLDAKRVALGQQLFHDTRLSGNGTIACSTCHPLADGGMDGRPTSIGINGAVGPINAPTVLNVAFNFVQFWDGRAATLEDQVDGPTHNPIEMGSDWKQIVEKLRTDDEIVAAFAEAFSDGLNEQNIRSAIADFERSLVTVNSRFDRFLKGDEQALTTEEREGYELFRGYGCVSCHQGVNLGGNMYQTMGAMGDYFADRGGEISTADLGRFNVTGKDGDRHKFKVPGLRNVELTEPYFHDAGAETLKEAVITMARYQLGRELPDEDTGKIIAFLRTLTGELPE